MSKKGHKTKTTNEKPVSLHRVDFETALQGLLTVKPPKERSNKSNKNRKNDK
jgi:hypothetical protein